MKRTIIVTILFFSTVLAAHAQTPIYTFKDIRQPNGQVRRGAVERVDVLACGASKSLRIYNPPALERCMLARGWAVDQVTGEPAPNSRSWGTEVGTEPSLPTEDDSDAFRQAASQEPIAAVNAATFGQ